MSKVSALDFSDELQSLLKEYGDEAKQAVEESIEDIAKESKQRMKTAGSFKGKDYRRSWTIKVGKKRLTVKSVVYNKNHYQLTHLLEFGHATRGGGRTRAFEHIAPVNNWAQSEVVNRLKEKLGK